MAENLTPTIEAPRPELPTQEVLGMQRDELSANPIVIPTDTQISGLSASDAKAKAAELRALAAQHGVPLDLQSRLLAMAGEAEQRATQAAAEEDQDIAPQPAARSGRFPPITKFERAIFNFMSREEQEYLQSIDPQKRYTVIGVDSNGNVVEGSEREVTGEQLREDFSRIKFHTLSKEEQEKVREESKAPLSNDKEEMKKLQESLKNIEGHEATKIIDEKLSAADRPEMLAAAKAQIKDEHGHYKKAHEQAQQIIDKVTELEKKQEHVKGLEAMKSLPSGIPALDMQKTLAELALPEAKKNLENDTKKATKEIEGMKKELGKTLQEDVIDKALLGKAEESPMMAKSQGQEIKITHDKDAKDVVVPALAHAAPARSNANALG